MIRLARHKRGIHESEHRLWLFGTNILFTPFALILWGVGAAHNGKKTHYYIRRYSRLTHLQSIGSA
jgi:hypothetical protein